MHARVVLEVGKGVLFREVSLFGIHARVVLGVGKGVLVREVSSFQRLKEWYLWWVKVSCLVRCPHFRGWNACKSGTWGG